MCEGATSLQSDPATSFLIFSMGKTWIVAPLGVFCFLFFLVVDVSVANAAFIYFDVSFQYEISSASFETFGVGIGVDAGKTLFGARRNNVIHWDVLNHTNLFHLGKPNVPEVSTPLVPEPVIFEFQNDMPQSINMKLHGLRRLVDEITVNGNGNREISLYTLCQYVVEIIDLRDHRRPYAVGFNLWYFLHERHGNPPVRIKWTHNDASNSIHVVHKEAAETQEKDALEHFKPQHGYYLEFPAGGFYNSQGEFYQPKFHMDISGKW